MTNRVARQVDLLQIAVVSLHWFCVLGTDKLHLQILKIVHVQV